MCPDGTDDNRHAVAPAIAGVMPERPDSLIDVQVCQVH
jgi:hypothetical protein